MIINIITVIIIRMLNLLTHSGHVIYHKVERLKILCSTHTVYLCVLCVSQNAQRSFPYTALTYFFTAEPEIVYYAVRAKCLNIRVVQVILAKARFRSQVSPHEICGGTGTGFSSSTSGFPCEYHFNSAPDSSSFTCCSYQKVKPAKTGKLPKRQCSFGNRGAFDRNVLLLSL
jgi:hypothetical protein